MDLERIPFIVYSDTLDFGFSKERVWVAMNLIDNECHGLGCSKTEAVEKMRAASDRKYGDAMTYGEEF